MSDKPTKDFKLEDLPPEVQDAVQGRAREYTRTNKIASRQRASTKKRRRKQGVMHRPGSNWYAIESFFDPSLIESTPIEDSGFMMGVLEDMLVVEVDNTDDQWPPVKVKQLGELLGSMGLKVLIVHKGIRFMRLRGCNTEEAAKLNSVLKERKSDGNGSVS